MYGSHFAKANIYKPLQPFTMAVVSPYHLLLNFCFSVLSFHRSRRKPLYDLVAEQYTITVGAIAMIIAANICT